MTTAIRVVHMVGRVIAGVLVLGIVLAVVDANEENALVEAVLDIARFFAQPFRRMFVLDDKEMQIAINWGIAAVAYLVIAAAVAAVLRALASALESRRR